MGETPSRRSLNRPPDLHIRLFGSFELRRGRILPPLATHKTQSLFAYLVLHRDAPQSREKLAALFWGDQTDQRSRRSLATALWRIRALLPAEYLCVDSTSIQFDPGSKFRLDVAEFDQHMQVANQATDADARAQHWREAVTLYGGDLLEGFFDDWCVEERYRLETLYLDALRRLVAHFEAQCNHAAVQKYASMYLARDPLEASLHLASMRASMALGRGTEARRQWQTCCEIWQQDLHSSPPADIVAQAAVILGAQFTAPAPPQAPAPAPWRRRASLDAPPFVGRAQELSTLQSQWEQAMQGRAVTVLIGGEAGVGKSRLVDEFAARVRYQGGNVARGRCWEPERNLAYHPLVEILQELNPDLLSSLPTWARRELARLLPELGHAGEHDDAAPRPDHRLGRTALLSAVVAAFRDSAAQAPLLVILEDVHAASESTLAALSFLARQTGRARVLLLVSYRTEEVLSGHPLYDLCAQLVHEALAVFMPLERLSAGATAELVERVRADGQNAELAARLYNHTQGNPLFLIETLRALQEAKSIARLPVPDSVSLLIHHRLTRVGPRGQLMLACAAVAGQAFDFDIVSSIAGLDEEPALEAMDELLRRGFMREGAGIAGQDYEFEHPLIQEVVYADLHLRRRRRLHRLMGEALERMRRDRPALLPGQMAYHFDQAQVGDKALAYADQAVDRSWDLGTASEVVHFCQMAMHWLDRVGAETLGASGALAKSFDLRLEQEEALDILGRREEREQVLRAMSNLAERLGDDSRRALVHIRRFWFHYLTDSREAYAQAERALTLAERDGDTPAHVQALYIVALAWAALGEPARGLSFARAAVARARGLNDRVLEGWSLLQLGYIFKQLGDWANSRSTLTESVAVNRARGNPFALSRTLLHLGDVCQKIGDGGQARQHYQEALALAREIGFVWAEQDALKRLGEQA